jgi:hypothetical protein
MIPTLPLLSPAAPAWQAWTTGDQQGQHLLG